MNQKLIAMKEMLSGVNLATTAIFTDYAGTLIKTGTELKDVSLKPGSLGVLHDIVDKSLLFSVVSGDTFMTLNNDLARLIPLAHKPYYIWSHSGNACMAYYRGENEIAYLGPTFGRYPRSEAIRIFSSAINKHLFGDIETKVLRLISDGSGYRNIAPALGYPSRILINNNPYGLALIFGSEAYLSKPEIHSTIEQIRHNFIKTNFFGRFPEVSLTDGSYFIALAMSTKAEAIQRSLSVPYMAKRLSGVETLICFGDDRNDACMFEATRRLFNGNIKVHNIFVGDLPESYAYVSAVDPQAFWLPGSDDAVFAVLGHLLK